MSTWGVHAPRLPISGSIPSPRLLAAARVLVGLSQRDLAGEAGLAVSSVGRYEAGLSTLRADSLAAILEVLRRRGVRFIDPTDEVEAGLVLLRPTPGSRGTGSGAAG